MQNNHQLNTDKQNLQLWRYPKQTSDSPLQAWDNGDILLAESALKHQIEQNPVILNDNFGAISLLLNAKNPILYSDSYISGLATLQNAEDNQLKSPPLCHQLNDLPTSNHYLLKIPKNLDFLEAQLHQINQLLPPNGKVLATARVDQMTSGVKKLLNRYFYQVDIGLAVKKFRLIELSEPTQAPYSSYRYFATSYSPSNCELASAPNVFSRKQLDQGAAFLVQHLPDCTGLKVIDLACGNGVLSCETLVKFKPKQLLLVDESYMAIESAKKNTELFAQHSRLCYEIDDCLSKQADASADLILCNPPFHQIQTITTHIATQMFVDAARVLRKDGRLLVVANRHLPYVKILQKHFASVDCLAQNRKFMIYLAVKGSE
ncbi:methyltransferase [Gayadomonas joobiniege]|uniref:methyltransferase n=1 Tax=Gayadomonas joobiniege TaxID=1234606 RepID=UPI0005916B20|nr:class I SAM-dependent methyltransferase [Gayadomonas joobiniege]